MSFLGPLYLVYYEPISPKLSISTDWAQIYYFKQQNVAKLHLTS